MQRRSQPPQPGSIAVVAKALPLAELEHEFKDEPPARFARNTVTRGTVCVNVSG